MFHDQVIFLQATVVFFLLTNVVSALMATCARRLLNHYAGSHGYRRASNASSTQSSASAPKRTHTLPVGLGRRSRTPQMSSLTSDYSRPAAATLSTSGWRSSISLSRNFGVSCSGTSELVSAGTALHARTGPRWWEKHGADADA